MPSTDVIAQFLSLQPPAEVAAGELYARYLVHSAASGAAPVSRRVFGLRATASGVTRRHTRTGEVYVFSAQAPEPTAGVAIADARREELVALVRHLHERRTPEQRRWATEEARFQLDAGARGEARVLAEATLAMGEA